MVAIFILCLLVASSLIGFLLFICHKILSMKLDTSGLESTTFLSGMSSTELLGGLSAVPSFDVPNATNVSDNVLLSSHSFFSFHNLG